MSEEALIDNDVLHKGAMYGLIEQLLQGVEFEVERYMMLGSAKYIIRKKIAKCPPSRGLEAALEQFEHEIEGIEILEPSAEEVEFAADLELIAQRKNLPLDSGESILCAILTLRGCGYILTGDKRAIKALEDIKKLDERVAIDRNLICLEQLFIWVVEHSGIDAIRLAVCSEYAVDKSLTSCFSCHSDNVTSESCKEGLQSYISSLRKAAPSILSTNP